MDDLYLIFPLNEKWKEVEAALNDKRYTVKDTDASYRALNHWTEQGLLDDDRTDGAAGASSPSRRSFGCASWPSCGSSAFLSKSSERRTGRSRPRILLSLKQALPCASEAFYSCFCRCF